MVSNAVCKVLDKCTHVSLVSIVRRNVVLFEIMVLLPRLLETMIMALITSRAGVAFIHQASKIL